MSNADPTPEPSEVTETTAGERDECPLAGRPHNLTECVYGDCVPATPDAADALYAGEGLDVEAYADDRYGDWLRDRADSIARGGAR